MFRRWTTLLLLVLASACTGTTPPSDAEPSAREPPAAAPSVAAPAVPVEPAVDPKNEVLQLAIDLPQLDGFWHVDVRPERVPLKIAPHSDLPASISLVKFGKPVVIEKDAPLHFETIRVGEDEARVGYRYDPEGVIVDVRLQHDGTRWRVVDADVAER